MDIRHFLTVVNLFAAVSAHAFTDGSPHFREHVDVPPSKVFQHFKLECLHGEPDFDKYYHESEKSAACLSYNGYFETAARFKEACTADGISSKLGEMEIILKPVLVKEDARFEAIWHESYSGAFTIECVQSSTVAAPKIIQPELDPTQTLPNFRHACLERQPRDLNVQHFEANVYDSKELKTNQLTSTNVLSRCYSPGEDFKHLTQLKRACDQDLNELIPGAEHHFLQIWNAQIGRVPEFTLNITCEGTYFVK